MGFALVQGRNLYYLRRGKGVPLLLIHGFPLDHSVWDLLADYLVGDFDLILPDLPGFGQSEQIPGDLFSIPSLAAVLREFLDQLDITTINIAGHSMGGYIALEFARAYPECVLGLGLLASQASADTPERKAGRYSLAEKVAHFGTQALSDMADRLTNKPDLVPVLREIILRQPPNTLVDALKAMAIRGDANGYLERFKFPIVLVHGLADTLIPSERAHEVKSKIPSARLVEIPGVGHSPMLEAPVETAQAINFLRIGNRS